MSQAGFGRDALKCQALLDEQALLSCMAYVDLNPVRAAMAKTPVASSHTSIRHRINHWQDAANDSPGRVDIDRSDEPFQPDNLHAFVGNLRQPISKGIIFNLLDYLQLVD